MLIKHILILYRYDFAPPSLSQSPPEEAEAEMTGIVVETPVEGERDGMLNRPTWTPRDESLYWRFRKPSDSHWAAF